ncbi:MAG: hypothetical protein LUH36_07860, partial [Oscillospiraceae bacterium]|nr:hypothetical protein [Oscillospiraceae bacterium]
PHHVSPTRTPMSAADRAAQFSPFAPLTGHGAALREAARLTEERAELTQESLEALDRRLQIIKAALPQRPEVAMTVFIPDEKKAGGAYVTMTGAVVSIDEYDRTLLMQDGRRVPLDDIAALESPLFRVMEG